MEKTLRVSVLLAFLVTAVPGCARTENSPLDLPKHLEVVCDGVYVPERVTGIFDRWVRETIGKAGSSFGVWAVGPDRHSYHRLFLGRIPDTWGSNVMQAKTAFIRVCRGRLGSLTLSSPPECLSGLASPLLPGDMGRHEVHVLSVDISLRAGPDGAGSGKPLHAAVISDRSSSMRDILDDQGSAIRDAFDRWVRKAGTLKESTFNAYVVDQSYASTRRNFFVAVPPFSLGERVAYVLGGRRELLQAECRDVGKNASAVVEALNVAVREMKDRPGGHELLILSDMRQFTPGVWNFERAVPEAEAFLSWLKREGLDIDLSGISITVCGFHNHRSPEASAFSARTFADIQGLWRTVFQKMGADEVRFFTRYDRTVLSSR